MSDEAIRHLIRQYVEANKENGELDVEKTLELLQKGCPVCRARLDWEELSTITDEL